MFLRIAISFLLLTLGPGASCFRPRSDIGSPAGLVPECPGVMKNATISPAMMQLLQVIVHRLNDGNVHRRTLPIASAHKTIAKEKSLDFKKKTVFYAVGFFDSSIFPQSQAIANAYAKRGYNVLISETFSFLTYIYPKSVRLSKVIGEKIGEFLVKLYKQGLDPDKLELVGISLGAHIAGFASKHFLAVTGRKPSRITGLDPAGPCYRALPPKSRLSADDAAKVDILHTNIDGFGIAERLGHVDFYANGGEYQPGDIPYIPCLVVCSHVRAAFYWWLAVEHPKKFIGVKCDSIADARHANCYNNSQTNYVGAETNFNKPGIYYLPTHNEFPYYRGKEGLKEENEIYTSVSRNINADDTFVV
ncbi:lipase member H-like [Epargyreus clarus]|uniref:lipase member H-like n=1 Tax=Epargyreus clarus TaxID=520877 RepID=UPI003C30B34F